MDETNEDILRLLQEASEAPSPSTEVELLNDVVWLADSRQNLELGVLARKRLMAAALTAGRPEEMVAAFTWCLGQSDRRPDKVAIEELLWQYRWVISRLPHFPDISLNRIHSAIEDMTKRYREVGSTLRSVHLLKLNTAIRLNDAASADEAYREWSTVSRDWLSDDPVTERCFVVEYLVFTGKDADAVNLAKYVLRGHVSTDHSFGEDSAELLMPLLKAGRIAEAKRVQQTGYPYVAGSDQMLDMIARHVEFLARIDEFDQAASILEKHAHRAVKTKLLLDRLRLFRAVLLLVLRMRPHVGHALKMPSEIPVMRIEGKCRLDELAVWLREDVAVMSKKFDDRNDNTYLMDRLRSIDELATLPVPAERS